MRQSLLHLEVSAVGVITREVNAPGGAELAQAAEGVGHGVHAIAQIQHQLW